MIADPHYDLAFTTLMLANPPLGGPTPVRTAARVIGTRLANRFLHSYVQRSGNPIDPDRLTWGRQVHALRALVELDTWAAQGTANTHADHPWYALQPHFEAQLLTHSHPWTGRTNRQTREQRHTIDHKKGNQV